MNRDLLKEMIEGGYVVVQKHPLEELYIYNYSQKAQFERVWNEVTLQCRGLILDNCFNTVARPFRKFFNLGETENQYIPDEPFEVYEKMDGSLGILYWINDQPFIASRGSFNSEQAKRATTILYKKYSSGFDKLDRSKTYLFEIIYPENRIVVEYGTMEELILLAVIDNATGEESRLEDIGFPIVQRYHGVKDIQSLKCMEEANREGFVIKFSSGLRYKVKFEEYLRLHRILTQVSTITIWEYLKEGSTMDTIIDRVPDEFYDWVRKTHLQLLNNYTEIERKALAEYKEMDDRKATAAYFLSCSYPSILFYMLDKKDYSSLIWKMIRPEFSKPFANYEE